MNNCELERHMTVYCFCEKKNEEKNTKPKERRKSNQSAWFV